MTTTTGFTLKGYHVFAGFALAFGIIIAVNVTLAVKAVKTFPGLEVKNSYVASQNFDKDRAAQEALGWSIYADVKGTVLEVSITDADGQPVQAVSLTGTMGRATTVSEDRTPEFAFNGQMYLADIGEIGAGNWNLRMEAVAVDGTVFKQRVIIHHE